MSKRARHEFMVGFVGEGQCVYGENEPLTDPPTYIDPLTWSQAQQCRRRLVKNGLGHPVAIFRLVPAKGEAK